MGIDLGTATVLVHLRDKGIVLHEPSVVAIEQQSRKVLAVGETRRMLGNPATLLPSGRCGRVSLPILTLRKLCCATLLPP